MYGSTGWPELIILLVVLTWAFRRVRRVRGGRLMFVFRAAALTLIVLVTLVLVWNFSIQFLPHTPGR